MAMSGAPPSHAELLGDVLGRLDPKLPEPEAGTAGLKIA
jgi:hypothetical protein